MGRTASPSLYPGALRARARDLARAPHARRGDGGPSLTADASLCSSASARSRRQLAARSSRGSRRSLETAEAGRADPEPARHHPARLALLPPHLARARRGGAPRARRAARQGQDRSPPMVALVMCALILTMQEYYGGRAFFELHDLPVDREALHAERARHAREVRRAVRLRVVGRRHASAATCCRSSSGRSSSARTRSSTSGLRTQAASSTTRGSTGCSSRWCSPRCSS